MRPLVFHYVPELQIATSANQIDIESIIVRIKTRVEDAMFLRIKTAMLSLMKVMTRFRMSESALPEEKRKL